MMEMVMFGVVLTVAMVVANLIMMIIGFKVMFSPKLWDKSIKMSMELVKKMENMEFEDSKEDEA